jgi:hypothetical protein
MKKKDVTIVKPKTGPFIKYLIPLRIRCVLFTYSLSQFSGRRNTISIEALSLLRVFGAKAFHQY